MNKFLKNFWKKKINSIYWKKKPKIIYKDKSFYPDGKTNIAYNCLRNNINNGQGNKIAIITIDKHGVIEKFTFKQLEILIDNFITYLKKHYRERNQSQKCPCGGTFIKGYSDKKHFKTQKHLKYLETVNII